MYLKLIDNLFKQNKFKNMCIVFNGLKRRVLVEIKDMVIMDMVVMDLDMDMVTVARGTTLKKIKSKFFVRHQKYFRK
jgi:hypothetical protein